jgi:hypothetical protein
MDKDIDKGNKHKMGSIGSHYIHVGLFTLLISEALTSGSGTTENVVCNGCGIRACLVTIPNSPTRLRPSISTAALHHHYFIMNNKSF